jgi:molybdenum cofactor biosynthesis protein MoaC
MGRKAFKLLMANRLPKGDALKLGEAAGILAAKRTPEAIPLCHPLPLDKIALSFKLDGTLPGLHALCEVSAHARTGVEMEALSGVCGALLSVYDLVKPLDPALTISELRLETKEGGKTGFWRHPDSTQEENGPRKAPGHLGPAADRVITRGSAASKIRQEVAVITVSDRCFRGESKDISGKLLGKGLRRLGFSVARPIIVPDEKDRIVETIERLAHKARLVVLTGGTGLSPRDLTPEALESACERVIPGIGEALRASANSSTPLSSLSRSTAGQLGGTLVIALPGSPSAIQDSLRVLAELLPHALHIARGGSHQ